MQKTYGQEIKELYAEIDDAVQSYYKKNSGKIICKAGCSDCCSQFFEISMVEYIIILDSLLKLEDTYLQKLYENARDYMDRMKREYPALYDQVTTIEATTQIAEAKAVFNKERFLHYYPCIFLNQDTGTCNVYSDRPLICRTTGSGYTSKFDVVKTCPHIKWTLFPGFKKADLRRFLKSIIGVDVLQPSKDKAYGSYKTITFKKRPIAYYIADTFMDKKSRLFYENLCKVYFNITREEIANEFIDAKKSEFL